MKQWSFTNIKKILQNTMQIRSNDDHNHFQEFLKCNMSIRVKVETPCLWTTALLICKIHYFWVMQKPNNELLDLWNGTDRMSWNVTNYRSALHNILEEQTYHLHCSESLKSCMLNFLLCTQHWQAWQTEYFELGNGTVHLKHMVSIKQLSVITAFFRKKKVTFAQMSN